MKVRVLKRQILGHFRRAPATLGGLSGETELRCVINAGVRGGVEARTPMASFPSKPTCRKPECDLQL